MHGYKILADSPATHSRWAITRSGICGAHKLPRLIRRLHRVLEPDMLPLDRAKPLPTHTHAVKTRIEFLDRPQQYGRFMQCAL